ncbi:MAG: helix-turn-helix transcriptional regulator [Bacilli bacterium]|nr:helix-turn-helix transcriptional regulator [Bacilli bacterium]
MYYTKLMKNIRTDKDMTQKEMANILNTKRTTYSGWENGIDSIPLLKLNEFCNYFNLSLDYICGLSKTKNTKIIKKEIDKINVGNRLKEIRLANNDTQEYIATIIGTIQTNYSKYERGETLILTSYIIEFAKHYNISIDWLCGKTKDSEIK